MKPQTDYTTEDFLRACQQWNKAFEDFAVKLGAILPRPTRWQRFTMAVDDLKQTMIAGMRVTWLYVLVFWAGIAIGALAGWLEWGMR